MLYCEAEENVPIPTGTVTYENLRAKINAAAATGMLLLEHGYCAPPKKNFNRNATQVMSAVASNLDISRTSTAVNNLLSDPYGAQLIHNILNRYDEQIVKNAAQLRTYITNRLIEESDNKDARVRLRALELLGKITDVGLFTERSEIEVTTRSVTEITDRLKDRLSRLVGKEQPITDVPEKEYLLETPVEEDDPHALPSFSTPPRRS